MLFFLFLLVYDWYIVEYLTSFVFFLLSTHAAAMYYFIILGFQYHYNTYSIDALDYLFFSMYSIG